MSGCLAINTAERYGVCYRMTMIVFSKNKYIKKIYFFIFKILFIYQHIKIKMI